VRENRFPQNYTKYQEVAETDLNHLIEMLLPESELEKVCFYYIVGSALRD